ncbi:DUF2207 domain-containing protein, partial [Eubacterium aggregans]|uniref:DUF2207 domain-containing protein n=1 Tax=Eubacterium aggregans TaxID=81409 RepID=UPI003F3E09B3
MRQKRFLLLGILAAFILFWGSTAFAAEYYTTPNYKVDMAVNENHSYDVTETITVSFTEPRHGIYRYIPQSGSFYREIDGKGVESTYNAVISNIRVDGYNYDTDTENGNLVLKIGDSDTTVDGTQVYTIHYTWDPGDDKIDGFDDVYFNILPYQWPTVIDHAAFTVHMPKAFNAGDVNVYAGSYGATDGNAISYTVDGTTITGETTNALTANQGATMNVRLPQGYFVGARTGLEGVPFIYGSCFIGLIAGGVLYFLFGRSKKPVEVVNFYPPHDFTPPQIGTIIDGRTDRKDLVAVIMYLADKGYLTIEETSKSSFTFHQLKRPGTKDEPDFIREIFTGIFPSKTSQSVTSESLKGTFYESVDAATAMVEGFFTAPEHQLFTAQSKIARFAVAAIMVIVMVIFAGAQTYASEGSLNLFILTFILVISVGFPAASFLCFYNMALINKKSCSGGKRLLISLLWAVLTLILISLSIAMNSLPANVALVAYGTIMALGILQFYTLSRTETGTLWYGET